MCVNLQGKGERAEALDTAGVQQKPKVAEVGQEISLEAKPLEKAKEEQQAEEAEEEEQREEEEEQSKDETKEEKQKPLSKSPSMSSTHSLGKRPLNIMHTPAITPVSSSALPDITASDEKKSPAKSGGSGAFASAKIHIPEYLGLVSVIIYM